MKKQFIRALGAGLASFISALLIYAEPPESLAQFIQWAWQPALQATLVVLGAYGINMGTRGKLQGPVPGLGVKKS